MRIACFKHRGRFGAAYPSLLLALTAGGDAATSAQAARPIITDDVRIVDAKSCQLESWVKQNRESTEYLALRACNSTDNLEVTVGSALTREVGQTRTTDLQIQGKTLFTPLGTNGWGIGLTAGTMRHPQVTTGGQDWNVYVPTSFLLRDDRVVVHTDVGWVREGETRRDRMTWGLGTEARLVSRTWLIAETFGQDQGKPFYQVGLRHWLLPDRVQLDATYVNRNGSGSGERWLSIGLRLLSVAFLP